MTDAPASVRAFAPATIGNCAVGFDVLGHSLAGHGDRVTATLTTTGEVRITAIRGADVPLPAAAADNTAGRAVQALLPHAPAGTGVDLEIDKGIALGSGMGGSAASAVAAAIAANALLPRPVALDVLYAAAIAGERVASGSAHGDNVGPALLGGLVIATSHGAPVRIRVPHWLHIGLVRPHFVLETRVARAALAGAYELREFVAQSEGLALVLAGCFVGDQTLLRRGLRDVLVEPRRAHLIPGFAKVKQAALDSGALGASIAGAGPATFGWFTSADAAARGTTAMRAAFAEVGLPSTALVSPVDGPKAQVIA